jgi:putative transposase
MPRFPRLDVPGYPQHVVVRGVDRRRCFVDFTDFAVYRHWLFSCADERHCDVHAFVLMSNHVHLMVTGRVAGALPAMMQSLGRRYVGYFNNRHGRTGPLFGGRYRSALVKSDAYALACIRYIDLNPVRAAMVEDPTTYRWSTCAAHALGHALAGWKPHATYLALASDGADRAGVYRRLLSEPLPDGVLDDLRWRIAHPHTRKEPIPEPGSEPGPEPGSGSQSGRRNRSSEARGAAPRPGPPGRV